MRDDEQFEIEKERERERQTDIEEKHFNAR